MLSILILLACTKDEPTDSGDIGAVDADGDGFDETVDCNDDDAAIHPDATEVCDGIDNDCDDAVDDADDDWDTSTGVSFYLDEDADTYGAGDEVWACESAGVDNADDCDDTDALQFPGADEVCNGEDDDCDTEIDEEAVDFGTFYADADTDGYGDPAVSEQACEASSGFVDNADDCDDTNIDLNPDSVWYADNDGDGYGDPDVSFTQCEQPSATVTDDQDCDDSDGDINPDSVWYADNDSDGYGDPDVSWTQCEQPSGSVTDDQDCDDGDGDINPDSVWYADNDSDGFGDPSVSFTRCEQPSGTVSDDTDCDDSDSDVNPGATEVCNGLDDDCDAGTSEDGFAAFDDGSTVTDYTSTLGAGTASTPADVTLSTDGTMSLCDGTYYVNFDVEADVDFAGVSGDEAAVILDGAATGSVIAIEADGVTVSLSDLTIQDGYGDVTSYSGDGGGGIACSGSSTLAAENIVVDSNYGYYGGPILLDGCSGTFDSVTVSNNEAYIGGAMVLLDATAEVYDSFIEDNYAEYGGVFYALNEDGTGSDLYFEDTTVTVDHGVEVAVGLIHTDSSFECVGDTATTGYGFADHDDATYGGIYGNHNGAEFHATDCDFDAAGGYDVYWGGEWFDGLGDDESFSCDDDGCAWIYWIYAMGNTTDDDGVSTRTNVGNTYLADSDATIESFEIYAMADASSCDLSYYVLSASSETDTTWTVEWSSTGHTLSTTAGWHDSGDVDFQVTSGTYYALIYSADCDATYYYGLSSLPTDVGFGTTAGYLWDTFSDLSGTATVSPYTNYLAPLGQNVSITP